MTEILELPHLAQDDSKTEMYIGSGRIDAEFDPQRPARLLRLRELRLKSLFWNDLHRPSLYRLELFIYSQLSAPVSIPVYVAPNRSTGQDQWSTARTSLTTLLIKFAAGSDLPRVLVCVQPPAPIDMPPSSVLDYGILCLSDGDRALIAMVEMRRMRTEDVPAVMVIERECFTVPWSENRAYMTELANRSAYYIVACVDSEIVGYGGEWVIMDEAHITTLGVSKEWRGHKIGERVLVALLEEAIRKHARRATLEVRESNTVAQNLYRKYGFQPAAIRRGYYTDNHENAVVMWVDNLSGLAYTATLQRAQAAPRRQTPSMSHGEDGP